MELELFISWPPSWPGSNWQSLLSLSLPVTPRHFLPLTHITRSPTPWTSGDKRDLVRHWGWATRMWRLARGARRGRSIPSLSLRRSQGQTGLQVTLLQMAAFYIIKNINCIKTWIDLLFPEFHQFTRFFVYLRCFPLSFILIMECNAIPAVWTEQNCNPSILTCTRVTSKPHLLFIFRV